MPRQPNRLIIALRFTLPNQCHTIVRLSDTRRHDTIVRRHRQGIFTCTIARFRTLQKCGRPLKHACCSAILSPKERILLKLVGYILTLLYLTGVFFPEVFPAIILLISQMAGHAAFALFALLIARGLHRSINHFQYFLRLVVAAFATELISALASWQLRVVMPERNPLFTYAAGIAMLAGLAMAVGCYHDLVAHAIPANGKWDKKTLFGVPVNPGNYRISPVVGLVVGLFSMGIAIFVTVFFRFSHGLFGLLFVAVSFLAMRDSDDQKLPRFPRSMFTDTTSLLRTLLYAVSLVLTFALVDMIIRRAGTVYSFTRMATLISIPLAVVLPEPNTPPGTTRRWLTYAALPALTAIVALIRLMIR